MIKEYPRHESEFKACSLLRPSKHNYADVESRNTLKRAHRQMIRLREMDKILQNAQRQGRISFYMTCTGEVRDVRRLLLMCLVIRPTNVSIRCIHSRAFCRRHLGSHPYWFGIGIDTRGYGLGSVS